MGPGTAALSGSGFLFFQILILLLISGLTANLYSPCRLLSPQIGHLAAPAWTTQQHCAHCPHLEQASTVIQPHTMPGTAPAPPLGLTSLHPLGLQSICKAILKAMPGPGNNPLLPSPGYSNAYHLPPPDHTHHQPPFTLMTPYQTLD